MSDEPMSPTSPSSMSLDGEEVEIDTPDEERRGSGNMDRKKKKVGIKVKKTDSKKDLMKVFFSLPLPPARH